MGDACPFPLDPSNAATIHWLGLIAILALAGMLGLVTAFLCARIKIEDLEDEREALFHAFDRQETELEALRLKYREIGHG